MSLPSSFTIVQGVTKRFASGMKATPCTIRRLGSTTVTGSVDSAPEKIPLGFVFNTNGVPAVAKIISVTQAVR
jgi:hypothetical protein